MTEPQRARPFATAARVAAAGVIIAGGALAMAGQACADPAVPYPTPVPADPGAPPPPDGTPVAVAADAPVGPPPPADLTPQVPQVQNPVYGQGQTPGQLGYLRDIWHAMHTTDPAAALTAPPATVPGATGAPDGAGPAPQLPPGYVSLTAPESSTGTIPGTGPQPYQGGPALPPGYYPITGPPPPGYFDPAAPDPAAPPTLPYAPTP
ncbi:hypothetical protein [Mycolicibacterium komossense]|uniref:Uncharacterized protein n=1 Tax=Mycolicibacterium komossense TaxID=1779 RepID=A0ABT3CAR5_9MYCO|nr:hypothetical protein [Mycolicibacterium komossense]MCV7226567.1 hypothetical protein [Mycolicibacterium komossense]